jgi:hypothetical protein
MNPFTKNVEPPPAQPVWKIFDMCRDIASIAPDKGDRRS